MTLRVSVVIPAYNEQATILQVLRQVRKQSLDGVAFEVIVVDDGSHDNTVTLLEANPACRRDNDGWTRLCSLRGRITLLRAFRR